MPKIKVEPPQWDLTQVWAVFAPSGYLYTVHMNEYEAYRTVGSSEGYRVMLATLKELPR